MLITPGKQTISINSSATFWFWEADMLRIDECNDMSDERNDMTDEGCNMGYEISIWVMKDVTCNKPLEIIDIAMTILQFIQQCTKSNSKDHFN